MKKIVVLLMMGVLTACGGSKSDGNEKPKTKNTSALYTQCKPEIEKLLTYPDSMDVKITSVGSRDLNDGKELRFKFTAKNAFGGELPYTAVCEFDKDDEIISANAYE